MKSPAGLRFGRTCEIISMMRLVGAMLSRTSYEQYLPLLVCLMLGSLLLSLRATTGHVVAPVDTKLENEGREMDPEGGYWVTGVPDVLVPWTCGKFCPACSEAFRGDGVS